ncbi:DUF1173 family protein [Agrobacterium sp. Azo12]|uniref:DUF1173 family protein n=1 Tax=Agrobacterium sp. Azo12 TaxID=3031129 RepID=UPI0023D803F0|nr:DUF1173 family protein [Agrobacterium sp. Azo12]MDO5897232.1 DUF1173 family protein [Agrobacterium sp. Azo12]
MLTSENWIPVDTVSEVDSVAELTRQSRQFTKGLRYDVRDKPIAAALVTDRHPPKALFIAETEVTEALQDALAESEKATNSRLGFRPQVRMLFRTDMISVNGYSNM